MVKGTLKRKSVTTVTADMGDYDTPQVQPSLIQLLALSMLRQACNNAPWLTSAGYAVSVVVPSLKWTTPLAEAMRYLVAETRQQNIETLTVQNLERFDQDGYESEYVEFIRGTEKRNYGGDAVAEVLSLGHTLIAFSVSERQLPVNLVRSIDESVLVVPPTWSNLKKAIEMHTGTVPTVILTDAQCAKIEPEDLTLATRPSQTPDEYLTRLKKLLRVPASVEKEGDDSVPLLKDVHGMSEAVEWGQSLAQDMAEYAAGRLDWRDVDKGVLLVGRPGTGKTSFVRSLVKTVSQTCNAEVQFIHASYARWQKAGHLNDFLKAMAYDFEAAAEVKPSIMFVDEMDSFVDRAKMRGDNAEYCRQTVNALLEHLDGTAKREGVVVVAATNDMGQIDPALLRPGRMDRVINIPLPDAKALQGIFRQHAGVATDLGDLTDIAHLARGASGAQVEQWCRLARRHARSERRELTRDDLLSVVMEAVGPARSEEYQQVAAVHEAGHAYVIAEENPDILAFVSIRGAGAVAGMTASKIDDRPIGLKELKSMTRQTLGGRAAEMVLLGKVTDGSGGGRHSDLGRAANMATLAVSHGLVDETPRWYAGSNDCTHILVTRPDVAEQVDKLLAEAWHATVAMVKSGRVAIRKIADELVKQETLQADAVLDIISASKKETASPSLYDSSEHEEHMYRC